MTPRATEDPHTLDASVDMGPVEVLPEPAGWAALGTHPDRPVAHLGLGNPHSVVGVDDVHAVDLLALGTKVPHVNLEIIEPGPERDSITMRVHERGVGETRSCGTGAAAAALATRFWSGVEDLSPWIVDVPGGRLTVTPLPGQRVELAGPAELVADGDFPL